MKILVTGGAGFIGSHFVKHIIRKYPHYEVINLDALTYAGNLKNLAEIENHPNYTFVKGNICDKNIVRKLISEVDIVVNFAAESHVDNSIMAPEIFIETNVNGTYNLLQASKEVGISRYIQISTDEVYGSLDKTGKFTEDSPLLPNSPYSASKASADLLVRSYFKTYQLPAIITRCSNNFGPNQSPEKLIPFFISKLLKNEKVPVYGQGINVRDWIYVQDHINALDLVLHKGKIGEIYNIGADNEKTNIEITKILLDFMSKDYFYIQYVTDRPGHDLRYAIDSTKICSKLGWKPLTSFNEGIINTIEWYINNQLWLETCSIGGCV